MQRDNILINYTHEAHKQRVETYQKQLGVFRVQAQRTPKGFPNFWQTQIF